MRSAHDSVEQRNLAAVYCSTGAHCAMDAKGNVSSPEF